MNIKNIGAHVMQTLKILHKLAAVTETFYVRVFAYTTVLGLVCDSVYLKRVQDSNAAIAFFRGQDGKRFACRQLCAGRIWCVVLWG